MYTVKHLKISGVGNRIEDASGAKLEFELRVKSRRPSRVRICGTREEVAAARDLLEQNAVTEAVPVMPEVIRVMAANNFSEQNRIQKASGAFLSFLNMNTVLMVGSKEEVEVASRMVLDQVSKN